MLEWMKFNLIRLHIWAEFIFIKRERSEINNLGSAGLRQQWESSQLTYLDSDYPSPISQRKISKK